MLSLRRFSHGQNQRKNGHPSARSQRLITFATTTATTATTTTTSVRSRYAIDILPVLHRRSGLLLSGAFLLNLLAPLESQAFEWGATDLARKVLRPESDAQTAVVALMDAVSILKSVSQLAATPMDSEERFHSRALLPGYAKYLREVATAAPVVAQVITGDKEATLSEKYGGTSGSTGLTDPVFETLGRVLTISGRTLKVEALDSPLLADQASTAIQAFLAEVPRQEFDKAQQFRVARAALKATVAQKQ